MADTLARQALDLYAPLGFLSRTYVRVRLWMSPLDEVAELCPGEGLIVDLGCGTGLFAHLLRLGSDRRRIRASDLDAGRIETARRTGGEGEQLRFEVGDALEADLSGVTCMTVVDLLHHMTYPQQEALLRRIHDALPDGGLLILKDLEKRPLWKYLFHYVQDTLSYRGRLYFRSRQDFVNLLERTGFAVTVVAFRRWFPYPHIAYRCTKRGRTEVTRGHPAG